MRTHPLTPEAIRQIFADEGTRREKLAKLFEERCRTECGDMRCMEGRCSCWEWAKQMVTQ